MIGDGKRGLRSRRIRMDCLVLANMSSGRRPLDRSPDFTVLEASLLIGGGKSLPCKWWWWWWSEFGSGEWKLASVNGVAAA